MKLGGNDEFFQIVSEIRLPVDSVECRHQHALVKWYRERHIALLDGFDFSVPRPDVEVANKELSWVQRFNTAKTKVSIAGVFMGKGIKSFGFKIR